MNTTLTPKKKQGWGRGAWLGALLALLLATATPLRAQEVDDYDVVEETPADDEEDVLAHALDSLLNDTVGVDPSLVWPRNLCTKLDHLLESKMFNTTQVGMVVYDLTADSVIFSHNARQLMRPASTMKMMNAVTALDQLGGSFLFRTRLRMTGSTDSLTLRGNLYLEGGMDPLFNGDDMRAFAESVKRLGIDTIRGNICADLSMKDSNKWGEGWCWDDDNPVLTPLLVNGEDKFMRRFCNELRRVGITWVGDTLRGITPGTAMELCSRTHTIDQVLQRMMKNSDNLFAECMFYQLAANGNKKGTATAKGARQAVNAIIRKVGLAPDDYYIADGSGLSLYNYVSPELEMRFLRYAWQNDNILTHLLTALPIAGVDGTLGSRMTRGAARANVKAKTGTVTGVSSLAGYCTAANGHHLCFSIINMGIRKSQTGRSFQDKVCDALCTKYPTPW